MWSSFAQSTSDCCDLSCQKTLLNFDHITASYTNIRCPKQTHERQMEALQNACPSAKAQPVSATGLDHAM